MRIMLALLSVICIIYLVGSIIHTVIVPRIILKGIRIVERDPKWLMSKLKENYYGFEHIQIVLCTSEWGKLPCFNLNKKADKLEMWVDYDTTTTYDVEEIGQIALSALIKIKYGLDYPDKSIEWLSLLLFILDGGDPDTLKNM